MVFVQKNSVWYGRDDASLKVIKSQHVSHKNSEILVIMVNAGDGYWDDGNTMEQMWISWCRYGNGNICSFGDWMVLVVYEIRDSKNYKIYNNSVLTIVVAMVMIIMMVVMMIIMMMMMCGTENDPGSHY